MNVITVVAHGTLSGIIGELRAEEGQLRSWLVERVIEVKELRL